MLRVSRISKFFPSEPGKDAAPTPALCGPTLTATEGRLAAGTGVEACVPEAGTRKRKSRWSDTPPEKTAILGTQSAPHPITTSTSSPGLSEEQQHQLLEQIEVWCVCVLGLVHTGIGSAYEG